MLNQEAMMWHPTYIIALCNILSLRPAQSSGLAFLIELGKSLIGVVGIQLDQLSIDLLYDI